MREKISSHRINENKFWSKENNENSYLENKFLHVIKIYIYI